MPVSIVTDPQGKQYKVTHPEGASESDIFNVLQQQTTQQSLPPKVIDAEDPLALDVVKGLFTGAAESTVSTIAGITQWAGQVYQSDSMLEAAQDLRQYGQGIGENVGLDREFGESFAGQVFRGIGQLPVTAAAGAAGFAAGNVPGMIGAAALTTGGQMSSEFLGDMEQTLQKGYTDFDENEKDQALVGMLAQTAIGTALETAALGKIMRPVLRQLQKGGVSNKALKKAIEKQKSALRQMGESSLAEGGTGDCVKAQKYVKKGMEQYMTVLHFKGLNNVVCHELKQEVYNGWIIHGTDTTLKSIKQTLQMCDK